MCYNRQFWKSIICNVTALSTGASPSTSQTVSPLLCFYSLRVEGPTKLSISLQSTNRGLRTLTNGRKTSRMKRQNRNHRGQTNSPFEGHGLLSLSRQQREERRVGREGGCYSWLPLMWGQERVRQGGLGGGGWRCGQGTEGKREENLVSAFLFLLFNLAGCHTQSTPPPSLHPPIPRSSQSLFVSKATASHVSLTTGPLPTHPPHNLNRQCSDYHGVAATRGAWPREGEDVMWTEETERAGRRRMKAEGK